MKTKIKPIAMRCSKKQYNEIKNKLNHIDNHDCRMNFKEYPYLTNNYDNEFSIGTHDKSLIRKKVEIHETWNEKVFLEACGIETIPTLEEVKEYFKNAKEVECMFDKKIYDITDSIIEEDREGKFSANLGEDKTYVRLYKKGEFAKIVSYKESFVITREQIYDLCHPSLKTNRERLEVYFPSCFEPEKKELVVGRWYKTTENDSIFFLNKKNKKSLYGYGISYEGNWKDAFEGTDDGCKYEATQQEVEEALKAEFIKKGYKENSYLKYPWFEESKTYQPIIKGEIEYIEDENSLYAGGVRIFNQGQWAEIIQPKKMTKAEIETELGYCVEIVK